MLEVVLFMRAKTMRLPKARAANYKLTWNMTNFKARPEKVIPAKEAYSLRRKTITIKDVG